jgi:uncharacterized protein YecE (DUF72 family)
MVGLIRVGIGGWTYEPWRGVFYPPGLSQKKELEFASRAVTSIEINGTYYSTFKPESWRNWRDATPEGFVFAVKASRFCTNRRVLADGAASITKFLDQGLIELGPKLGPINWQFMATKKFDPADFAAFLKLLPRERNGLALRHAVEVRSPTFVNQEFVTMARDHNVAIVTAMDDEFPEIDERTADFTFARFMATSAAAKDGVSPKELKTLANKARGWAAGGDLFAYFIAGEKVLNPAAAQALIRVLAKG